MLPQKKIEHPVYYPNLFILVTIISLCYIRFKNKNSATCIWETSHFEWKTFFFSNEYQNKKIISFQIDTMTKFLWFLTEAFTYWWYNIHITICLYIIYYNLYMIIINKQFNVFVPIFIKRDHIFFSMYVNASRIIKYKYVLSNIDVSTSIDEYIVMVILTILLL